MNLVDSNILGGTLPANGRIELSFDRLLLPASATRQTFVLNQLVGGGATTTVPTITYDPVARVVTITPLPDAPFVAGQSYELFIVSPSSPSDLFGFRAIDGAGLSASSPSELSFTVAKAVPAAPPQPPVVDFCRDILPMFTSKCAGATCHNGTPPNALPVAEGLLLSSAEGVIATAIDQVAHGSNTGPLSGAAEAPSLLFAEDVPIIDPGSQSANILPADAGEPEPSPAESTGDASSDAVTDGGANDATAVTDGGANDAAADATAADGGAAVGDAAASADDAGSEAALVTGDPAHSWIMYKLLMSAPPECSSTPGAAACDSGAPAEATVSPNPTGVYAVDCDDAGDPCPTALSDAERARLANMVQGIAMPYPTSATGVNAQAMTVDELELVSFWIAQGAPLPENCQ